MPRSSDKVTLTDHHRQWVVDKVATRDWIKETCRRIAQAKLWLTTIGGVAVSTMAYVRSDDLLGMLVAIARVFGAK